MIFVVLLALLVLGAQSGEWNASTFPNSALEKFKQCGMENRARLCDPDSILSETARTRLDQDLKKLKSFCVRKGLTAVLVIARRVSNGTSDSVRAIATHMLHKWKLDSKCKKAMLILVSIDDMKVWVEKDENVPIWSDNFTEIFDQQVRKIFFRTTNGEQKPLLHQNDYQGAISNMISQTSKVVETQWRHPNDYNGRLTNINKDPDLHDPRFGHHADYIVPSITGWFWAILLFAVVPITCCCLCSYLCCCREKVELPSELSPYEKAYKTRENHVSTIFVKTASTRERQFAAAYDFDHEYSENRPCTSYNPRPNQGVYSSHLHHGGGGSWA